VLILQTIASFDPNEIDMILVLANAFAYLGTLYTML